MQTAPVPASVRFPHARQVFVLTRHVTDLAGGHPRTEVCYGITSLDACRAGPARLAWPCWSAGSDRSRRCTGVVSWSSTRTDHRSAPATALR